MKGYGVLVGIFGWVLLALPLPGAAQKENQIFFFGNGAGLDLGTQPPGFLKSSLVSSEAAATLCDAQGRVLFYTDGTTVWDKTHRPMRNGERILGGGTWPNGRIGNSATQGALIVPSLQNSEQYYLFTVNSYEKTKGSYPGYLRYSVIDMSLNDGRGALVSKLKNTVLDSFVSEKLVAVQGDGCYLWVICRKKHRPEYVAYKVDASGIHPEPVVSSSLHPSDEYWGEMKVSPDGNLLAAVYTALEPPRAWLELNYFDKASGRVTGSVILDSSYNSLRAIESYGLEFSPGSNMLYAHLGDLYQYDLSLLPDYARIRDSRFWLGRHAISGMRRGPDGRIYIIAHFRGELSVIYEPDRPGKNCLLNWRAIRLPSWSAFPFRFRFYGYGLGNPVPAIKPTDTLFSGAPVLVRAGTPEVTVGGPDGYRRYLWSNGEQGPTTTCRQDTLLWVQAIDQCRIRIDSFRVQRGASLDHPASAGSAPAGQPSGLPEAAPPDRISD